MNETKTFRGTHRWESHAEAEALKKFYQWAEKNPRYELIRRVSCVTKPALFNKVACEVTLELVKKPIPLTLRHVMVYN